MKLKDIIPYCLDYPKNPGGSYTTKYFWVIGGFTYTIDSLQSYASTDYPLSDDIYTKFNYQKHYNNYIELSRYNFCNHDEIQKKYDPDNNYLSLNLDNEITIFDKFIMVHKTESETTESEGKLFFKTHYYVANGHDFSSDCYTLGLYHTDALGGMATNLRTIFKDLIVPPVQPKPVELTLDEKVDDLITDLMKDSRTMAIKKLKRMLNERL